MIQIMRITPETARQKVVSGSALLVCAYDNPQKFQNNHLEGAISLDEFKTRLRDLSNDIQIIFYCA